MDNANLENLVALGYKLGYNLDGLTSEEIDRINQALAASSVDLNRMTEVIDNITELWNEVWGTVKEYCESLKETLMEIFPGEGYHYFKTVDFLLIGNKVTPRCIYLAYCRSGKVAKKNLNRIRREYFLWVKRNPDLGHSKDLV